MYNCVNLMISLDNSIIKIKIQIFSKAIIKFNNFYWDKKIIDLIIYCGGTTRATKFFSDGKIVKNNWLKNLYFEKFGEKISKNKMIDGIFMNLYSYEDDLKKLLVYFLFLKFKGKIEKIVKKANISKEEIINKIKELGLSLPKPKPIKIKIYKRAKKGFVTIKDIIKISRELNCTVQNVRINVKKMNILYKSSSQLKRDKEKKEFKKQIRYFKNNKFVLFKEKYWINKNGKVFKVNNKNKVKSIVPILRKNQHGYIYSIISIKSKQYHFHKLIAELFIDNPKKYKYVRAIDKNPSNINIDNLEWIKYPAVSRVINKINEKDKSWLNFVIENINVGLSFSNTCKKLTKIADKNDFFNQNNNKKSTIESIIKNYSQSNPVFPIFNIDRDSNNKVYVNCELLKKIKKRKTLTLS